MQYFKILFFVILLSIINTLSFANYEVDPQVIEDAKSKMNETIDNVRKVPAFDENGQFSGYKEINPDANGLDMQLQLQTKPSEIVAVPRECDPEDSNCKD